MGYVVQYVVVLVTPVRSPQCVSVITPVVTLTSPYTFFELFQSDFHVGILKLFYEIVTESRHYPRVSQNLWGTVVKSPQKSSVEV